MKELTEHIEALRRYALLLTRSRDRAEDLVQECLLRAIEAADRWRPGVSLRPWLFRILHNVHVSQIRHERVRGSTVDPDEADLPARGDPTDARALRDLLDALARLPEGQREAVTLMALEDISYQEAASILDVPLGTFMSRLSRGRATLRSAMSGEVPPRLRLVGEKS